MKNVVLLHNPVLEYRPDSSVPVNIMATAERIAGLLGGDIVSADDAGENPYFVPFAAVHEPLAHKKGITGSGDVYGGVVKEPEHADKAILHELPSTGSSRPIWYSPAFAKEVSGVVLSGFTAFTPEDTLDALTPCKSWGSPPDLRIHPIRVGWGNS